MGNRRGNPQDSWAAALNNEQLVWCTHYTGPASKRAQKLTKQLTEEIYQGRQEIVCRFMHAQSANIQPGWLDRYPHAANLFHATVAAQCNEHLDQVEYCADSLWSVCGLKSITPAFHKQPLRKRILNDIHSRLESQWKTDATPTSLWHNAFVISALHEHILPILLQHHSDISGYLAIPEKPNPASMWPRMLNFYYTMYIRRGQTIAENSFPGILRKW
jgi:hypothetical protein